jgi:flagellar M-ring protein FliF
MGQLRKLLASLSLLQKVSIGLTAGLVLAAIYGFSIWHKDADFKPLYTGVAAEDAGVIVQKIKESGVEYRLSDSGGVISVPSASVAELRIQLAAAGLPKTGRIGFELFDKTSFGTTEFVEHVNYGRALEGELERSVMTLGAVEEARIHLTFTKDSVFTESREPAKASVILKLRPGMALSASNVAAVQQLVASAVEGLNTDGVSVVNTEGELLSRRKLSPQEEASGSAYEYRLRVEHDLLEKIGLTLDPMLGHAMYRASVAVDCDLTSGEQNEETFDPTKSVMTNSQKTEDVSGGVTAGGIPGTASNLPRPPPKVSGGGTTTSRRTEDVSYESSHLIRKTILPQGTIKRVSVAVLLDQTVRWEGKGNLAKAIFTPPTPDAIKAVHDIIAGIAGYTEQRGDQIVVETVPFQTTADQPPPASQKPPVAHTAPKVTGWREWISNTEVLIAAGAGGALVFVVLGGTVLLRRKRAPSAKAVADEPAPVAPGPVVPAVGSGTTAESVQAALAARSAAQESANTSALAAFKVPVVSTRKSEILVKELRQTAKKDASVEAAVLQTWIGGD